MKSASTHQQPSTQLPGVVSQVNYSPFHRPGQSKDSTGNNRSLVYAFAGKHTLLHLYSSPAHGDLQHTSLNTHYVARDDWKGKPGRRAARESLTQGPIKFLKIYRLKLVDTLFSFVVLHFRTPFLVVHTTLPARGRRRIAYKYAYSSPRCSICWAPGRHERVYLNLSLNINPQGNIHSRRVSKEPSESNYPFVFFPLFWKSAPDPLSSQGQRSAILPSYVFSPFTVVHLF